MVFLDWTSFTGVLLALEANKTPGSAGIPEIHNALIYNLTNIKKRIEKKTPSHYTKYGEENSTRHWLQCRGPR
jgi:hypothetical protein